MSQTAYPAAREAAARVHAHFARSASEHKSPAPDQETIAAIIDAAFWASLRREEGYLPLISLAFTAAADLPRPLIFEQPLTLASQPLTRLAAAVERPGIHLGVFREHGELRVWGATRSLPPSCFVLEVVAPGLLVIKQSRSDESGKFINVAVLQGEDIKVIDQRGVSVPECPALVQLLTDVESQFSSDSTVNVLIQLAVSMRAHHRGGILLVVPPLTSVWKESILQPIAYSVIPPYSALADLMQKDPLERPKRRWQDALVRAVEGIAGLTAVDGATVITTDYDLLAFGTKILRRKRWPRVSQVIVTEPIEGVLPLIAEPAQLGGTRHLSAAQFVQDQPDAIAMVASQDGRFTVFAWSPSETSVRAHRIDSLLL